jgi:hypothetical protein
MVVYFPSDLLYLKNFHYYIYLDLCYIIKGIIITMIIVITKNGE